MEELNQTVEATNPEVESDAEAKEQTGKYYTPEEIALIEQKAGDKRISQYQKTLDRRNKEAAKLSKMTDDEKFQYELEQREKALEEKERALTLAENKNAVSKILSEKGISLALVDFCVDEDADEMDRKIKLLDAEFKKSVKAEVEKRLSSNTPKVGLPREDVMTKDAFRKLSLKDQQEFYKTNKELYEQFTH